MSRTFVRRLLWIAITVCCTGSVASFAQTHNTLKLYQDGAFALGFTHIVNTPSGILYYNAIRARVRSGRWMRHGHAHDAQGLRARRIRHWVYADRQHAGRHPGLQRDDRRGRDRQARRGRQSHDSQVVSSRRLRDRIHADRQHTERNPLLQRTDGRGSRGTHSVTQSSRPSSDLDRPSQRS